MDAMMMRTEIMDDDGRSGTTEQRRWATRRRGRSVAGAAEVRAVDAELQVLLQVLMRALTL